MFADEITLPAHARSVPTARDFVVSVLEARGLTDVLWEAALCATELATNAVLHARTSFTVRVSGAGPGCARLSVSDGSPRSPLARGHGIEAGTGRGMYLVAILALRWGVETTDAGKEVWLVLGVDPSCD
jgi:anti-sigma regulatory factor (Ser/Thr protein kinase)